MNTRVHVFISGKVQGVFFRSSTKDMAKKSGLSAGSGTLLTGGWKLFLKVKRTQLRKC